MDGRFDPSGVGKWFANAATFRGFHPSADGLCTLFPFGEPGREEREVGSANVHEKKSRQRMWFSGILVGAGFDRAQARSVLIC